MYRGVQYLFNGNVVCRLLLHIFEITGLGVSLLSSTINPRHDYQLTSLS